MTTKIHTIGGYGHTKTSFFEALKRNEIDILIDIRQRRGMRGKKYSFLNSNALQHELASAQIAYAHIKKLAPSSDARAAQKTNDRLVGETKQGRKDLSDEFKILYHRNIIENTDIETIIQQISPYKNPCFFCVEGPSSACHRSLVAAWINKEKGLPVNDITP